MKSPRRCGRPSRVFTAALVVSAVGWVSVVSARDGSTPATSSLRSRFGVEEALRVLRSRSRGDADGASRDRLAAIARLGSIGSRRAVDVLAELALSGNLNGRELLTVVRALAPNAKHDAARRVLARTLAEASHGETPELARQARAVAALGLAKDGSVASLKLLGGALRRDATTAALAAEALHTHPPKTLAPLLAGPPSEAVVALLGTLGDQRAFGPLRALVKRAPVQVQATAAIALAKLGAMETVELARWWLKEGAPPHRRAAAEILLSARARDSADALRARIADGDAEEVLGLARRHPDPVLLPVLTTLEPSLTRTELGELAALVSAMPTASAVEWLAERLEQAGQTTTMVLALARNAHPQAEDVLWEAARKPALRLVALRGLLVRAVLHGKTLPEARWKAALGDPPSNGQRYVQTLLACASDPDRAVSALGADQPRDVRVAVSHTAWLQPAEFFGEAGRQLANAPDTAHAIAASFALAHPAGAAQLSTRALLRLYESAPAIRPLVTLVLAGRDDPMLHARIEGWLGASDPVLRRAAILGLGQSKDVSSMHWLAERYQWETDATARVAVMTALSQRPELWARRLLLHARDYEPTPSARETAATALSTGPILRVQARGADSLWVDVHDTTAASSTVLPLVEIDLGAGVIVPLLPGPDGVVVVPGLPSGVSALSVAPWAPGATNQ